MQDKEDRKGCCNLCLCCLVWRGGEGSFCTVAGLNLGWTADRWEVKKKKAKKEKDGRVLEKKEKQALWVGGVRARKRGGGPTVLIWKSSMYIYSNTSSPVQAQHRSYVWKADPERLQENFSIRQLLAARCAKRGCVLSLQRTPGTRKQWELLVVFKDLCVFAGVVVFLKQKQKQKWRTKLFPCVAFFFLKIKKKESKWNMRFFPR